MDVSRRKFLTAVSMLGAVGCTLPAWGFGLQPERKLRIALVGTGIRGISFWGRRLLEQYGDRLEFVGLSDINKGRLEFGREYIGARCPTFVNFEEMMRKTKPDLLIVTTVDSTHHEFIIKGLEMGSDVLTEKPLTTDEDKCQQIIDAEKKSDKNLIVGFNYRWSPYATKVKELLMDNVIGKVTSVDFHWYLNTYHGASYFRRWHGLKEKGGTLWVHKATHHFDLMNWLLDSDPEEVFAYGALEHYGHNGPFSGPNCRSCQYKDKCEYYWDITKSERDMALYANHEKHDGYIRDSCLFRKEIDIYDKMSAQVKYKNNTVLNYSLTTYSPFEGWRLAFNGTEGRLEAWLDIPYQKEVQVDQAKLHAAEMSQEKQENLDTEPMIVHRLWKDFETIHVPVEKSGHGGGDKRLHDKIFVHPEQKDPFDRAAGLRDGAMSMLIGVAARKSIETGKPIRIGDLTSLQPSVKRGG